MRLIGNKTKLLGEIEGFLAERGVRGGTLLDVFAGTGSVAQHFRRRGFRVRTNDLLRASWVRQRVYVELSAYPAFAGVLAEPAVRRFARAGQAAALGAPCPEAAPLCAVLGYLDAGLAPGREPGLFGRQYAEGGAGGRLFFSAENGARIDAIHGQLEAWRRAGRLSEPEHALLLCALLEAADRVANISGTYGAFLKRLQASARERLTLRPPLLDTQGPPGRAYCGEAGALARRLSVDVLYLDPPYNHRQYAKNYHVLEVLAELHTVEDLAAYEAGIYGKSGLRPMADRLSDYCRKSARRGAESPCERAFRALVQSARAEHIVVSYNEEGILSREAIGEALAEASGAAGFDFVRDFREVSYKRFRSDRDAAARRYRVLAGRGRDEVAEWLFYARKPRARRASAAATRAAERHR